MAPEADTKGLFLRVRNHSVLPAYPSPSVCCPMKTVLFGVLSLGLPMLALAAEADALVRAVRNRETAAWQALLQQKAGLDARDSAGNTALHLAALNHDAAAVRALLAAGAAVDARNAGDATPLLYGAGSAEIVRLLLAQRADPNAGSKLKYTPLMAAAMQPQTFESVQLLVAAGADVRAVRNTSTDTVLDRAVLGGDRRTIDLLLEKKPAQEALNSALIAATADGDIALVRLLLEKGADINYDGRFTGHALNVALFGEYPDIARLLLERGASPHARSSLALATPAMVWSAYNQSGDASVARALRAAGAEINAADAQNATALTYALRSGAETPLVAYLRSAGATTPEPARTRRAPERPVPDAPAERATLARQRLEPTLELLRRSSMAFLDNGFVQQQGCTSCHGQDLSSVVFDLAKARGLRVDDAAWGRQLARQLSRWNERAENARQMARPLPGTPITVSYGLFGLRASGHAADDMTDAMARYLMRTQKPEGVWPDGTRRPPMEDGALIATAWAALSVRDYAPASDVAAKADSQRRSARWLAAQQPATHNEAVFQLLGLHWSGEPPAKTATARERIVRSQRPDGGWAQLPGLESDAWGTGIALYALHEAGGMQAADPVYQRGVAFLLRTQFDDGSWWVRSRVWPFQPHFDGQFPHGKDQWISQAASAWAAMALLYTIEPVKPAVAPPNTKELVAAFERAPAGQVRKAMALAAAAALAVARVDFARDIQPVLERSCAGCHGGKKPRADFVVATRDALLKGGRSGEAAITPGAADESLLLKYVSGKIEDLEMPPLDRREKYPALSAAEIGLLRAWINAGAPLGAGDQ